MSQASRDAKDSRRDFLARIGAVSTLLGVPLYAAACDQQSKAKSTKRFDGKLRLPPGQQLAELAPPSADAGKSEAPDASKVAQPKELAPRKPAPPKLEVYDARDLDRERNPPGQQEKLTALRPMGGTPHRDTSRRAFSLRVHGLVEKELKLSFLDLADFPQVQQTCDVHCVTRWSMFDTVWKGVRLNEIAERAGVSKKARHVIFEAAFGYTANIELDEAMKDNVLVTYEFAGSALAPTHGAPVRSLVPDLYFWKSAKWLTGIKFVERDEPGFWERGQYHNHADPWKEERFG